MLKQILTIARHELSLTLATRRAFAAAALYLMAALLGGFGYVKSLKAMERHATHLLTSRGVDPAQASTAIGNAVRQSYEQLVAFLAGTNGTPVAASILNSVVLPAFLWGSLAFLPFLVVLTSFDMIANDLQSRSLCYSVLRTSRLSILVGKLLAHTTLFIALSVIASATLMGVAAYSLDGFETLSALPGLIRVWLVLLPYGICYLGFSALCSASIKQPTLALMAAFALMITLRILGLFAHVPEGHALTPLRVLRWLSPAQYQSGLWEAGLTGPALSAMAYLAFGLASVFLTSQILQRRDL